MHSMYNLLNSVNSFSVPVIVEKLDCLMSSRQELKQSDVNVLNCSDRLKTQYFETLLAHLRNLSS